MEDSEVPYHWSGIAKSNLSRCHQAGGPRAGHGRPVAKGPLELGAKGTQPSKVQEKGVKRATPPGSERGIAASHQMIWRSGRFCDLVRRRATNACRVSSLARFADAFVCVIRVY